MSQEKIYKEYCSRFSSKEEAQDDLRERLIRFIGETKTTQKQIARKVCINESALSKWKNHKSISYENNMDLTLLNAERLHMYLISVGY